MSTNSSAVARRQQLIELLQRERGLLHPEGVVHLIPRNGRLRASLAQERMWFWDQVTWPRSFLHNVPLSARLRGPLDLAALRSAFETLVARQESLRTSFILEGPVVLQSIQDQVDIPLRVVDLSSRPDPLAEYEGFCLKEFRGVFDITQTPLMRTTVVRLADNDHVLLVSAHHIVWDGWSTGLLVHEISTHYRHALGLAEPLSDLSVLYADWAAWQHRYLTGDRLAYHTNFWKNQLAGARTVHLAPAISPPEGRVRDRGVTQPFSISADLTRALAELGRKEDATLFIVLLAGLSAVMHGLSGEDDFTIGGLIANRTTAQIGGIIGYFVNTVPLRSRLPSDRSFLDHLRYIRTVALEAFEHQALPIGRIARCVADRRSEGWDQPLYSIDFMLQTAERPEPDFGDVKVEIPDSNTRTADYDMGCIMWQRTSDLSKVEGLQCWWEYKTDLFDEGAIRTLIQRFVSTLELVARAPLTKMLELPVLKDGERDHSIVAGSPAALSPEDVVDAISQHAGESGSAAALVGMDGTTLTYKALNRAIEEAARRLASAGVGPESVVTISAMSAQQALVAACAALSRGTAFWLADESILEDAERALNAMHVVKVTGPELNIGAQNPLREDEPEPAPADPAQIVLDADAAGRTTAVMISRRSLLLGVENARDALKLEPSDVVLHHAPLLTETHAWLPLAPLAAGAELRLAYAPFELADLLFSSSITIVHTISSRLSDLLDACKDRRPAKLRAVVSTGDRISPDVICRWAAELPDIDLFSLYTPPGGAGPVMLHRVPPSTFTTEPWDLLGLPQPGNAAYLLNVRGNPVAPGAAGRLFIGGDGIASQYLGDPRLTAERFVPDPFSPNPGARMFDTGARARRRHDGLIERFDFHPGAVRIDGQFVVPDQIDATLVKHPEIRKSLTVSMRGPDGGWRVVSYVVPVDQPGPSAEAALAQYWREFHDSGVSTPRDLVMNALTHCLPSRDHLNRALADAVEDVRIGGSVLVTGVRNLRLRHAFHCVRQLAAADPDVLFSRVREQVKRELRHDPELAVDPNFFTHIARELPRVSGVLVQPHQGAANTVEAQFLFDVSIYLDHSDNGMPAENAVLVWKDNSSLSWLNELLDEKPSTLVVRGIPDRRVFEALAVERAFDETVPGATVKDLRRATTSSQEAIHPDVIASMAHRHGYKIAMTLDPHSPGRFTAALCRQADDPHILIMNLLQGENRDEPPADPPTSAPLAAAQRWAVVRHLREWMRNNVPAALHPSLIIPVSNIPELPDGQPNTFELRILAHGKERFPCGRLEPDLAEISGDAKEVGDDVG
jgi:non-ribosomal peptide synthetase component F